jgi:hypothetical protein
MMGVQGRCEAKAREEWFFNRLIVPSLVWFGQEDRHNTLCNGKVVNKRMRESERAREREREREREIERERERDRERDRET